jgi:RNA polymerase sigma-70 factor (ECF subfamily)
MIEVTTDLIRQATEGDEAVMSALYERYRDGVFRYLYYRVGDRHTAEDLTSEVFERMLRFIGSFKPPSSSFQAWLYQIARNLAIDHSRRMKVRNHLSLEEELIDQTNDIDTTVERRLNSETLAKALRKLPEEQRDVILMRFVSGMPIAETAQALHKSENAVKGLQRRALIALRDILSDLEVAYG